MPKPIRRPNSSARVWRRLGGCVFVALLWVIVVLQANLFSSAKGVTFDEPFYMNAGIRLYRQGDFWFLARFGVAPLPVLATHWVGAARSSKAVMPESDAWNLRPEDYPVIRVARQVHLLSALGLLSLVYAWLACRRGHFAAMVGSGLVAFSPTLVANACLATTDFDLAVMVLVTLAALVAFHHRPQWRRWLLLVLAFGIAVATKYSALVLSPLVLLAVLAAVQRDVRGEHRTRLGTATAWLRAAGGICLGTMAVSTILHGGNPLAVIRGIADQAMHGLTGHSAFLCGKLSHTGWWYYLPAAFLLKSTPAELLVALFGLLLLPRSLMRQVRSGTLDPSATAWLLAIGCFGLFAVTCRVNVGIRYILPVYPLFVLFAIDQLSSFRGGSRGWCFRCVGTALVCLQALAAWQIGPHYLSYFNPLVGGPSNGYRLLVDSNLDWGQDLPLLRQTLKPFSQKKVLLHYFGRDDPSHYGITCVRWEQGNPDQVRKCDLLAISATYLSGAYSSGTDPFRDFRKLEPIARAGYSILIFDLRTPAGTRAMEHALERRKGR